MVKILFYAESGILSGVAEHSYVSKIVIEQHGCDALTIDLNKIPQKLDVCVNDACGNCWGTGQTGNGCTKYNFVSDCSRAKIREH